MRKNIIFLVFLLIISSVVAQSASITLLAVAQRGDEYYGVPAQLHLEVRPGTGRVFIETIPLSRIDTQLSTRFAQQSACKYAQIDCSRYDFFYTIKSDSALVGGPSAGAATAALTVAVLKKYPIDTSVAITGTLSSGNLIGAIGHVKEKVEAAQKANITTVIVPAGQSIGRDENNETFDLTQLSNIRVVEANTLHDILVELSDEKPNAPQAIQVATYYTQTMREAARQLCEKAEILHNESLTRLNSSSTDEMKNLSYDASHALALAKETQEKYYVQASRCFSALVSSRTLLSKQGDTIDVDILNATISSFQNELMHRNLSTITDLQAMMIVQERLREAQELLSSDVAFATARLDSAISWASFFDKEGPSFSINEESVAHSCAKKIGENEELRQYLLLIFPSLGRQDDAHQTTLSLFEQKKYTQCLHSAMLLSAQLHAVLSTIGITEDEFELLVDRKLDAAQEAIAQQSAAGIFPMAAYSYYELGREIRNESASISLVYAEYALELSDFDLYFEKKKTWRLNYLYLPHLFFFISGVLLGIALAYRKPGRIRLR